MEKMISRRNSLLLQLKREFETAMKLAERRASYSEATERLNRLKELAVNFRQTQDMIEMEQPDMEAVASVFDHREQYENYYYTAKDALEKYIADINPDEVGSSSSGSDRTVVDTTEDLKRAMKLLLDTQRQVLQNHQEAAGSIDPAGGIQMSNRGPLLNVRLPPITVPIFDGDRKNWRSFKDIFVTTIHNRADLRGIIKMQYLLSYVQGDAKRLVSSFAISDVNYKEAWAALTDYYDKNKYTVFALVREFVDQPAVTAATPGNLRKLVTTSDDVVRQLGALGEEYNTRDPWLIHLLLEKLDMESRSIWSRKIIDVENPSFEDFLKFLHNRCDALETCMAFSKKSTVEAAKKEAARKTTQTEKKVQSLHTSTTTQKCAKCSSEHPIYQCSEFKAMDTQSKRELVKASNLCFNCLRSGHTAKNCESKSVCRNTYCKKRHHTLLCDTKSEVNTEVAKPQAVEEKKPVNNNEGESSGIGAAINALVAHVPGKAQQEAYVLPTAVIRVRRIDGGLLRARALIDSGSEASLISEACASKLGLPRSTGKVAISGLGQLNAGTTRGQVHLVMANRFDDTIVLQTKAYVMGKLTSTLPTQQCKLHPSLLGEEMQQGLADPAYHRPDAIDIILGSDVFLALLKPGQVKDNTGIPVAQNTIFGWIVSGTHVSCAPSIQANVSIVSLHLEVDINRTLRQFWEQEEVPTRQQLTPDETKAVEFFRTTLTRDGNGRFVVRLPFDHSKPALGESLTPAIKLLRSMEKRFRQNPEFHQQYSAFIQEYLTLGHMEEVPANQVQVPAAKCFYLPHHAVVKADSTTTKLRVVFNGSSVTSTGISLNDRLLAGPNVNQDLFSVFLRFRTHQVAFSADVEKMYRQVVVHPADRDFQRIVYRDSEDDPIKHYRLCTVTYGTKCAPYLAIEAMKQAARDSKAVYPEAATRIELDTYVDDFLSGAPTIEQAKTLKQQVMEILESAGFHLRKWTTNCPELLHDADTQPVDVKLGDQPDAVKALGIQWNPREDVFSFKVKLSMGSENTKRQLLSDSAKLFDPFGWLAPLTIRIKILFQQLWLCDLAWDDRLPPAVEAMWIEIKESLHLVEQIQIPRFAPNYNGKIQLHGFSDASELAYSAVVYARATDTAGNISVILLAAKTRVAPIKQVSLPRLELCAADLLATLMDSITAALTHLEVETWAWTDSSIVLQWLSALPRKWKTYVANRTSSILTTLPRERWNHVRSEDNPADCASRGVSPGELITHPLWWHGPEWLNRDAEQWRMAAGETIYDDDLLEVRPLKVHHAAAITVRRNYEPELTLLARRSNFTLIVRALAYTNRFLPTALKKEVFEPNLSPNELYEAKLQLARAAQYAVYKEEVELLALGKELPGKNKLASLHPFLDGQGTMRVGGRLQNSSYAYDIKHPVILPPKHRATELLLQDLHLRNYHAGPKLLTATVNQQFWIVGAQQAVRSTVSSCARCVRLKGKTAAQLMGSLPLARVMGTRAFTHVGVDYAGPVKVRGLCVRGAKTTKGYIAVFVCMSTKAVHLELASDLSTNVFICVLKRFVSRRSQPNEIWSDNGTNFVGADNWLREIKEALQSHNSAANRYLTNLGIKWVFNPPSAPHRGGIWEAAVKSAKKHLIAVLGSEPATFEELSTVLAQVEACLNSRPLCELSSNPDDFNALTPGHFLVGQPMNLIPEPGIGHVPVNRLDKWQLLQKHTTEIWTRWRDEYLASLQPRTKWRTTHDNLKEDQLVLVKNDNTPPAQWELARIVKLLPDPTGVVRTVTLRRGHVEYQRPIQKICVLPTTD